MDSKNDKSPANIEFKVQLSDEELGLHLFDDLNEKLKEWCRLSKESTSGRKTRAANRRADAMFDEIVSFKFPPVILPFNTDNTQPSTQENGHSTNYSTGDDSEASTTASSSTTGRVLRPRCRTPSVSRKREASPSTPAHRSIRANMKKSPDSNSSNVLSAALNQQHPSVSVTKIRQLLRADSAQKKREEEKERQERTRLERKAKEERAEAQKKLLLEERAVTAKLKREQRLLHAAEVRKAREKAKIEQKLKEGFPNISKIEPEKSKHRPPDTPQRQPQRQQPQQQQRVEQVVKNPVLEAQQDKPRRLDETFQKPTDGPDNIDISVQDETCDEHPKKVHAVAAWAKAPHLRDLVVAQFSKKGLDLVEQAFKLFGGVKLPVDLEKIFESHKLPHRKYLPRTSSAVWTPPHKPLKRTSSDVFTPTDQKR